MLDRGFALIVDDQGHIVRSKAAVRPGQLLAVEVSDGQFGAAVSGAPVSRKRPPPPQRRPGEPVLNASFLSRVTGGKPPSGGGGGAAVCTGAIWAYIFAERLDR